MRSVVAVKFLALDYKKYDPYAVRQVKGANLELWTYRLFKNGSLYLEEVFQKAITNSSSSSPSRLTAGQKAPLSSKTGSYTVEQHFKNKPGTMKELAQSIQEFILGLDPAVEEVPRKDYIAYKNRISQNIACMQIQKTRVLLYTKLGPKKVDAPKKLARDITNTQGWGSNKLELSVRSQSDLELVKPLLEQAYQKIGGSRFQSSPMSLFRVNRYI